MKGIVDTSENVSSISTTTLPLYREFFQNKSMIAKIIKFLTIHIMLRHMQIH